MKVNHRTAKTLSLSAIFFLAALTIALIPINIFCVNFPEWITVFLSVIFLRRAYCIHCNFQNAPYYKDNFAHSVYNIRCLLFALSLCISVLEFILFQRLQRCDFKL